MSLAKLGQVPGNRAGKATSEEAKARISLAMSGSGNPQWRGGHGDDRYCKEWRTIRRVIRTRDDFLCQHPRCYTPEMGSPHPVHHIDCDRGNNDHRNLITLCRQHHDLTIRGDKEYWTEFYQELQIRRF